MSPVMDDDCVPAEESVRKYPCPLSRKTRSAPPRRLRSRISRSEVVVIADDTGAGVKGAHHTSRHMYDTLSKLTARAGSMLAAVRPASCTDSTPTRVSFAPAAGATVGTAWIRPTTRRIFRPFMVVTARAVVGVSWVRFGTPPTTVKLRPDVTHTVWGFEPREWVLDIARVAISYLRWYV